MVAECWWNYLIEAISQWISVDINIAKVHKEVAMDFSLALGGTAIVEIDESFQVSYPLDDNIQQTLDELKTLLNELDPESSVSENVVDRENWNKNWQAYFKPVEISQQLIILPEWENPAEFSHQVKTRIRPAMAFGTGTHETTKLCLKILEECIHAKDRVLDIGTGSGILGISALHLGAAQIDAIENDPLTAENIRDNLELNKIQSGFNLQISDQPILNEPYDLMLINIIRAKLFPLLPNFFNSIRPGGQVIVSGLLISEDEETRDLLTDAPWNIIKTYTDNEWIAYLCLVE